MKVREVMTSDVSFCGQTTSLAEAAVTMWQRDCGVVPVVDNEKKIVGMITDRDICMALATKNRVAAHITVGEVANGQIVWCEPDDDAETALKTMRQQQVRRLPVVDGDGVLQGVLSISDCLRHAGKGKDKIARKKIFAALRDISSFHRFQLRETTAEIAESESDAPPKKSRKKSAAKFDDRDAANQSLATIAEQRLETIEDTDSANDAKDDLHLSGDEPANIAVETEPNDKSDKNDELKTEIQLERHNL